VEVRHTEKSTLDLAATTLDLERRVALLETMLHGHTLPPITLVLATRLYLDVHKPPPREARAARSAIRQLFLLDTRTLLLMGRAMHDPFPWRPFLLYAARSKRAGVAQAAEAYAHVAACAQGLLRLAGLPMLAPEDIGGTRLQEMLTKLNTL
jgi:hypothetical protein